MSENTEKTQEKKIEEKPVQAAEPRPEPVKEKEETPTKKPRKTADSSGKSRASKKDSSVLTLEAVRVLTTLPSNGNFFLTYETHEGTTKTISHWS